MKKRVLAVVLAGVMTVSGVSMMNPVARNVHAESSYSFGDCYLSDKDGNKTLLVGDPVLSNIGGLWQDGKELEEGVDWEFGDAEDYDQKTAFYYDNQQNEVAFDWENIPVEAFGKYVYRTTAVNFLFNPGYGTYKTIESSFPIAAWADDVCTVALNKDGKTVKIFNAYMENTDSLTLKVPAKATVGDKNYKVTSVDEYAVEGKVASVILPASVTRLEKSAFEDCKTLKNITIKGNLKSVGSKAFSGINNKAVFKIKANAKNFKKIVNRIKKAGAPALAKYKRI
ncbi:MAG: hypothetical protein E7277_05900 [Lachnospiraceae bacterium]|nr:hypothetical protein [Lachnospiraceae bacterium]